MRVATWKLWISISIQKPTTVVETRPTLRLYIYIAPYVPGLYIDFARLPATNNTCSFLVRITHVSPRDTGAYHVNHSPRCQNPLIVLKVTSGGAGVVRVYVETLPPSIVPHEFLNIS